MHCNICVDVHGSDVRLLKNGEHIDQDDASVTFRFTREYFLLRPRLSAHLTVQHSDPTLSQGWRKQFSIGPAWAWP